MGSIEKKIDNLDVRERLLLGLVALVLVLALWDGLIFSDQQEKFKVLSNEILIIENNFPKHEKARVELLEKVSQDPNVREKIRLSRLEKEIERLDEDLKKGTIGFISPREMVGFLKEMINKQSNLELISLLTLGAEAMIKFSVDEGDGVTTQKEGSHELVMANVYRHSLEMHLKGDYFTVLEYIKKLENIGWRFEWNLLGIEMEQYPISNVKIKISTLSMNEGWIGV